MKDEPGEKPNPLFKALNDSLVFVGACFMVFVLGGVSGYLLYPESSEIMSPVIREIKGEFVESESNLQLVIKIFFNNLRVSIILLLSGTLLVIPPLILAVNGFLVGFVLRVFLGEGHSIFDFIQYTILHSIFELPAVFLSAAVGIRIGLAYLFPGDSRVKTVSKRIEEAGALYVAGVVPLLILAAFIEVYISAAFIS